MKLSVLPDIDFVSAKKTIIESQVIKMYERITGRELARGDPVRLFILTIVNTIILLMNKINYTGKQNLLSYATGNNLDNVAAMMGATRLQASAAKVTEQFTLSAEMATGTVIPRGTRVSSGDTNYFALDDDLTIPSGSLSGSGTCTCINTGKEANGYALGTITTLVDPLPYVASVSNITVSSGGSDVEADDDFRNRASDSLESFSCAGPTGAYEYWAKTANSDISAVTVISPTPGDVYIYPLLTDGELPGDEVLREVDSICNDKNIRPLTDHVFVKAPDTVSYDINLTYYITTENAGLANAIKNKVTEAVEEYKTWQRRKIGRDINPSKLVQMVIAAGAKRVEVSSPVFTHVKNGSKEDNYGVELAICNTTNINNGGYEDE